MTLLKNLILSIVTLMVFGCNNSSNRTMDTAESLMQEHPKDALALLDSLKQYPITGKAANARFALLYSQALDKNFIDVTDDSLISVAGEWYSKRGDIREKFLSYYYKGVVNQNAKKYPEAITAFSRAQEFEEVLEDNYLLGLLYNQMGYIYKSHYDYTRSLEAFSKAHDYYKLAGKTNHKNYMLLTIAGCYWNIGDYTNSKKYYNEAINNGKRTNYKSLVELSSIELIGLYIEQQKYSDAQELYEEYQPIISSGSPKFTANLARLHYITGNYQTGAQELRSAWNSAKNYDDSIAIYINEYYIYKHLGETELSLYSLEKSEALKNKSVSIKLQQPVLDIQKKLIEKNLEYSKYKFRTERKIMGLTILSILALISIMIYGIKIRMDRKNEQLANYTDLLAEMKRTLQSMQDELNSALSNELSIINGRLNLINNLTVTFYEKQESPKAKDIFLKEVKNIIEGFVSNNEDLSYMEQAINHANNNLLHNIYKKYPTLTNSEKKLLCYIYAGFSSKAISVFLDIPIETVYNRKSRLLAKTGLSKQKN